ncbi:MAG TPA: FAD binding domain-containing protein [Streptosporangiaceae bacterium]
MKPAPFSYYRTGSVRETVAMLAELGDEAKILAGGQSLVPMMNFRLARPAALVDVTRIPGLEYLRAGPDGLRIGALTRHRTVELCADPAVLDGFGVLPRSARWIGHYPIRARGTFGGSIAHADPAAEWCLLAVLLEANVVLTGPSGVRAVPVSEFFEGFYTTSAEPDEMITELHFPRPARRAALTEFSQRQGDFAVVAAAVSVDLADPDPADPDPADPDPAACRSLRVVLGGVGPLPFVVDTAELGGQPATGATWRAAGELAAAQIDPPADGHGSAAYRKKLAATLVERALAEAAGLATSAGGPAPGRSAP